MYCIFTLIIAIITCKKKRVKAHYFLFFQENLMENPKGCFPKFVDGIHLKLVGVDYVPNVGGFELRICCMELAKWQTSVETSWVNSLQLWMSTFTQPKMIFFLTFQWVAIRTQIGDKLYILYGVTGQDDPLETLMNKECQEKSTWDGLTILPCISLIKSFGDPIILFPQS